MTDPLWPDERIYDASINLDCSGRAYFKAGYYVPLHDVKSMRDDYEQDWKRMRGTLNDARNLIDLLHGMVGEANRRIATLEAELLSAQNEIARGDEIIEMYEGDEARRDE